jgi:hypothetical protein
MTAPTDHLEASMKHRRTAIPLSALHGLAALLIGNCWSPLASAAPPLGTGADPCMTAAADYILWVPLVFNTDTLVKSGSGSYAYGERDCKWFVADVKMATYSHSWQSQDGQWHAEPMLYNAGPYDLPSSASFGGSIPLNKEDCNRLAVARRIYTRTNSEAGFTLRGTTAHVGNWSAGQCKMLLSSSTGAFPPRLEPSAAGWDTYRLLTRAKLRSTYQEVAVGFAEEPPK